MGTLQRSEQHPLFSVRSEQYEPLLKLRQPYFSGRNSPVKSFATSGDRIGSSPSQ
jgi:hypothetical protein